jgi:hypothetical protein
MATRDSGPTLRRCSSWARSLAHLLNSARSEPDDDLSLCAALFDVGERVGDLLEREDPVGHWLELTAIDQAGQQVEVVSAGVHEQIAVADTLTPVGFQNVATDPDQR